MYKGRRFHVDTSNKYRQFKFYNIIIQTKKFDVYMKDFTKEGREEEKG